MQLVRLTVNKRDIPIMRKARLPKPTFPQIVIFTGAEIRAIRKGFGPKMTQVRFARFFPVSAECIKSWELGRSTPFGSSGPRLQELKAWVDQQTKGKQAALRSALNSRRK